MNLTSIVRATAVGAALTVGAMLLPLGAQATYTPPIGIPAPSFGIEEQAGPATHYVDNTRPCSDSTNGTSSAPRCTIPATLSAGSVVEVHGGPYVYNKSGQIAHTLNGTAAAPVFIKGVGNPVFTCPAGTGSERELAFNGAYYIVEGIKVDARGWMSVYLVGDHGVFRNSETFGMGSNFNPSVSGQGTNHVIYSNYIHDNGPVPTPQEFDTHGIKFSANTSNLWILDNLLERNAGDDVQIGDDCIGGLSQCRTSTATWPHHIYIGRNIGRIGGENCIDIKQAKDVVISQNECSQFTPGGTSDGTAVVLHNANQRVWVLFNRIHDSWTGIRTNAHGTDDGPVGASQFIIGNLIYGIRSQAYSPSDGYTSGSAIVGWNVYDVVVADNTIYDSDRCFGFNSAAHSLAFLGNFCQTSSPQTWVYTVNGTKSQDYGFYSPETSATWGSSSILSLASLRNAGACANCREGDPLIDEAARPQAGSPLIGANVRHAAYQTFSLTYGLSIDYDATGVPRWAARSIGALEALGEPVPTPTPTPTPVPTPTPTPVPTPTPCPPCPACPPLPPPPSVSTAQTCQPDAVTLDQQGRITRVDKACTTTTIITY